MKEQQRIDPVALLDMELVFSNPYHGQIKFVKIGFNPNPSLDKFSNDGH